MIKIKSLFSKNKTTTFDQEFFSIFLFIEVKNNFRFSRYTKQTHRLGAFVKLSVSFIKILRGKKKTSSKERIVSLCEYNI
jgi:hypothetical protein